jgi:N-acetyl-anhydromuramyl-L-alanine amidase AmpD
MTDINTQEIIMSQFETPKLPEVKFNKNGYEIRTDILDMAKSLVTEDFHVKFSGWQMTATKDAKTGQIVSTVAMPEFPGLEKVLETAEKMYAFVNASKK